jgi:hypothetical protein
MLSGIAPFSFKQQAVMIFFGSELPFIIMEKNTLIQRLRARVAFAEPAS